MRVESGDELAETFRGARGDGSDASSAPSPDVLGPQLLRAYTQARASSPDFVLTVTEYVRHLAARIPQGEDVIEALDRWRHEELYLALGCARGLPRALAVFERTYVARVPMYTSRIRLQPDERAEVAARLRERLLAPRSGDVPPRIHDYTGQGSLEGWVRMAANRIALTLADQVAGAPAPSDNADLAIAAHSDPDVAILRQRFQHEFQEAFERAIRGLPDEDRALLRMYFVDRLRVDALGRLFGIDKSNVSRRLARARARVLKDTQAFLSEKLALEGSTFGNILVAVRSELRLSITRLLGKALDP